jgi:hypothetical protein
LGELSRLDADSAIRNFTLEDVHVEGTERIVEAVAKYDVDRYIHVSSHSADPKSSSEFYATKVGFPQRKPRHESSADQTRRDEVRRLLAASTPRPPSCDPPPCSVSRTTCCSSWLRP